MAEESEGWYYCEKHHTVESGRGCRSMDRMGPYPDKETAARAYEIARERTAKADAADRAWDGDE